MPADQAANLDKASVMRLAIAYLKVRSVVDARKLFLFQLSIDKIEVLLLDKIREEF